MCVLQHMKCIEVRMDVAKHLTSHKQKYALELARKKVEGGINAVCDLLKDSSMVVEIKKELDKINIMYVMLMTEKYSQLPVKDLEEIDNIIEDYLIKKYGEAVVNKV